MINTKNRAEKKYFKKEKCDFFQRVKEKFQNSNNLRTLLNDDLLAPKMQSYHENETKNIRNKSFNFLEEIFYRKNMKDNRINNYTFNSFIFRKTISPSIMRSSGSKDSLEREEISKLERDDRPKDKIDDTAVNKSMLDKYINPNENILRMNNSGSYFNDFFSFKKNSKKAIKNNLLKNVNDSNNNEESVMNEKQLNSYINSNVIHPRCEINSKNINNHHDKSKNKKKHSFNQRIFKERKNVNNDNYLFSYSYRKNRKDENIQFALGENNDNGCLDNENIESYINAKSSEKNNFACPQQVKNSSDLKNNKEIKSNLINENAKYIDDHTINHILKFQNVGSTHDNHEIKKTFNLIVEKNNKNDEINGDKKEESRKVDIIDLETNDKIVDELFDLIEFSEKQIKRSKISSITNSNVPKMNLDFNKLNIEQKNTINSLDIRSLDDLNNDISLNYLSKIQSSCVNFQKSIEMINIKNALNIDNNEKLNSQINHAKLNYLRKPYNGNKSNNIGIFKNSLNISNNALYINDILKQIEEESFITENIPDHSELKCKKENKRTSLISNNIVCDDTNNKKVNTTRAVSTKNVSDNNHSLYNTSYININDNKNLKYKINNTEQNNYQFQKENSFVFLDEKKEKEVSENPINVHFNVNLKFDFNLNNNSKNNPLYNNLVKDKNSNLNESIKYHDAALIYRLKKNRHNFSNLNNDRSINQANSGKFLCNISKIHEKNKNKSIDFVTKNNKIRNNINNKKGYLHKLTLSHITKGNKSQKSIHLNNDTIKNTMLSKNILPNPNNPIYNKKWNNQNSNNNLLGNSINNNFSRLNLFNNYILHKRSNLSERNTENSLKHRADTSLMNLYKTQKSNTNSGDIIFYKSYKKNIRHHSGYIKLHDTLLNNKSDTNPKISNIERNKALTKNKFTKSIKDNFFKREPKKKIVKNLKSDISNSLTINLMEYNHDDKIISLKKANGPKNGDEIIFKKKYDHIKNHNLLHNQKSSILKEERLAKNIHKKIPIPTEGNIYCQKNFINKKDLIYEISKASSTDRNVCQMTIDFFKDKENKNSENEYYKFEKNLNNKLKNSYSDRVNKNMGMIFNNKNNHNLDKNISLNLENDNKFSAISTNLKKIIENKNEILNKKEDININNHERKHLNSYNNNCFYGNHLLKKSKLDSTIQKNK